MEALLHAAAGCQGHSPLDLSRGLCQGAAAVGAVRSCAWHGRGGHRGFNGKGQTGECMAQFDFNIETMHLSCTVFELYSVFRRKWPISTHPTCICLPLMG